MPMKVTLTIPDELAAALEATAARRGTTIEGLISTLVRRSIRIRHGTRAGTAGAFLRRLAAERGDWSSAELFRRAKAEGISKNALFEAKDGTGIKTIRRGRHEGGAEWAWDLSALRSEGPLD